MASRACLGSADATRSRASTAINPVVPANNGLMSSSRISGWSDGELGDPDQDFSNDIDGCRRLAAIPLQAPPHARARHHRVRQRLIERRQCERGIPDLFDRRTAVAEHHHRTEYRVLDNPDDQFDRAGEPSHLLHEKPVELRFGAGARDAGEHRSRLTPHSVRTVEVERHAPDIALMRQIGRADLERHGVSDLGGCCGRTFCIGDEPGCG